MVCADSPKGEVYCFRKRSVPHNHRYGEKCAPKTSFSGLSQMVQGFLRKKLKNCICYPIYQKKERLHSFLSSDPRSLKNGDAPPKKKIIFRLYFGKYCFFRKSCQEISTVVRSGQHVALKRVACAAPAAVHNDAATIADLHPITDQGCREFAQLQSLSTTIFSMIFQIFLKFYIQNLFQVFYEFHSEFIQNLLNIFLKFLQRSFPKIFLKFVKIFPKISPKFSQDLDKILLENCSNFTFSLPKISRKFSLFRIISRNFSLQFHHISTFSQSINPSILRLSFNFFVKFYQVFLHFFSKNSSW